MEIIMKGVGDLKPYPKNAKVHDEKQIENVANSIRRFGWQQPIVIDESGVVVIGHCRLLAAKKLGLSEVPVTVAAGLTDEEIRELRIADNKTNESPWDFELLDADINGLDFDGFDLDFVEQSDLNEWFSSGDKGEAREGEDEYSEFLDKFELPHTTDDCYTPGKVYEAVADWVACEYNVDKKCFVRPFYPGGDYKSEKYKQSDIVVDNPPFSILAEIIRWYDANNVRFFLFCPGLTPFSSSQSACATCICAGVGIIYENKANVLTSFVTNLEPKNIRARTAPKLFKLVDAAVKEVAAETARSIPKYSYPDNVVTAAMMNKFSKYGINLAVTKNEAVCIDALDAQKEAGKAIFGKGYLLSEKAAAEKAAAEKAAAEKAAATRWPLSDREREIIKGLGNGHDSL